MRLVVVAWWESHRTTNAYYNQYEQQPGAQAPADLAAHLGTRVR
jgi:hypothetical protein